MNEVSMRIMELAQQGFFCSQILLLLALEAEGKENPELIRSMGGLAGGLGFCGKTCGTLTGGACLLSYYGGKGTEEEMNDDRLIGMIIELVHWFEANIAAKYGTCDCKDILGGDATNRAKICPKIVEDTYNKVREILLDNGYEII
jgi:C_GCAxxG_C_C family probable redox protein